MSGKDYHWFTSNHYSGGVKHNGMYVNQKSSHHDTWHKSMDNHHAAQTSGKTSNESSTPAAASESAQKLALNNKLQNAFFTQAGLSADAIDCIWEDAQGNN